jgi:hypothetical protein
MPIAAVMRVEVEASSDDCNVVVFSTDWLLVPLVLAIDAEYALQTHTGFK